MLEEKRAPEDFALWKRDEKHQMQWDSPWGRGFPGWHIECSAMARKYLGDTLDIHTGGEDNAFPHHECEIAQSEALTGKPFSNFWLHTRFLQLDGRRMAKSSGPMMVVEDLEARGYSPRVVRYFLLSAHYRTPLNFSWEGLDAAKATLDSLDAMMRGLAADSNAADRAEVAARLAQVEGRNLALYGYGVKGFTLSMIETAMELTNGQASAGIIRDILAAGREMLSQPVEPLPGVDQALAELSERYRLVLITKGDLLHQEQKLAASGLGDLFAAVEIVSEKDADTYRRVFERHGTGAAEAAMCGNSLKSDILPALEAGAWAAYLPYSVTWAHEMADAPTDHPRFAELGSISQLPGWLTKLTA